MGRCFPLLCAVLCFLWSPQANPQQHPSEEQVKAAYLFNFGKFVVYPAGNPQTFDICLLGSNGIGPDLDKIALNERVDNRPVRMLHYDKAADARNCAVVFMGDSETRNVEKDLAALEGANALTVSDIPHFLERGGMVQFVTENNRVRFAVNLDQVSRTRLVVSSELLKVAVQVIGQNGKRDRPAGDKP